MCKQCDGEWWSLCVFELEGNGGSFKLWNGLLQVSSLKDSGAMLACYAVPVSLESEMPPLWEFWPSTLMLKSRHSLDKDEDRQLLERFVQVNKVRKEGKKKHMASRVSWQHVQTLLGKIRSASDNIGCIV